ncbi:MAG: ABC transporter ATP-binding protein/permease [Fimbriiglobus sp.]|nr:ABC transporter ATP-binding protein/permease [Fimbriiglobus sp.]
MRNFLRVLRLSWAYRSRLVLAAVAAVLAALCWSLNISAAFPILKVLIQGQNLHEWVDKEIEQFEQQANDPKKLSDIRNMRAKQKELDENPIADDREDTLRRLARDIALKEKELAHAHEKAAQHRWLKLNAICHLPDNTFETFAWIVVALVVGIAVKGLFEFVQETMVGVVVQRTLFDFRNQFFRRGLHQDFKQLGETGPAELMARMTNDVEQLGTGMKMLYGRVMLEPLRMAASLACACFISWQLTLMFVAVVAVAVFALNKVSRAMKKAARKVLERMSELYRVLREAFDGLRVVKAFTGESRERRRFRAANEDYYKRTVRVINIDAAVGPILETLGILAVGLVLVAGAYLVINSQTHLFGVRMLDDKIGPEALLTLYLLLATIADPVRKLSSVWTKMQSGMVAADRIFALYDREPSVGANADGPMVPPHAQGVVFKNVSFSYLPGRSALNDVTLEVNAGETVALVGPNGCGKSTLLGLLPRFYDPDHGEILIDGVPLRTANLRSVRKQIGLVTQDTQLFDDTILANIAFGRPGATQEEVEAAAKAAHAHEFIAALPQGYQTRTGDMAASRLSGGQKQRLALARAILRDPRILILDEFTSQIDGESEAKIHEALRTFVKGRTTFLITHRRSTLELADRIVVMDGGRVVATGTHAELLVSSSTYRRLYDTEPTEGKNAA